MVHCAIWYQTLNSGVLLVGRNAVLTSKNTLERVSQESISLNPFVWHWNSYLTFNHSHDIYMTIEWHTNGISGKNSTSSSDSKGVVKDAIKAYFSQRQTLFETTTLYSLFDLF